MVPEGWQSVRLGDHVKIHSGYAPASLVISDSGTVPYVKVDDLNNCARTQIESKVRAEFNGRKVPKNTILFPKRGAAIMNNKVRIAGAELILDTNMMGLEARSTLNPWFAYYWLINEKLFKIADTSTIPQINNKHINPLSITLPSLPEQKKIGEILSTWDEAIETTEKLLANAEAQKRALMQQLLTGKRRMKGFEGSEWKRQRIGHLLKEVRRPVTWSDDDIYRLVSIRRRSGGAFLREELSGHEILTKIMKVTRSGDFLISKMQVVHGAMAMTPPELDGFHISGSYIVLIPRAKNVISIRFFDWLSRTRSMYRKAFLSSYGVHIEKMTFNLDWFFTEFIDAPEDVREQEAIAKLLDDAETVCRKLNEQGTQLRCEKNALMQQLLTGKKRVTV